MDILTGQEEPDASWSQTTTPTSEDIEEIVRSTTIARSKVVLEPRPRYLRGPIRRRVSKIKPRNNTGGGIITSNTSIILPTLDIKQSMEGSDASTCSSTLTIVTSTGSSCTGPWSSSSGFVEEEDDDDSWEHEDDDRSWDDNQTPVDEIIVPKLEPEDEAMNFADFKDSSFVETPSVTSSPVIIKRPRGRPRKHPKPNPEDKAKIAKNRSKTGCITCRRRKKKCDEKKPGCMNCEKNAVTCEGYQQKTMWKSGKEKAEEARVRRVSLPTIPLPPIITGVDTPGDMMFFEHYIFRLSTKFTVEGEENNAFKDILLPMAVQHPGLMHSILALASKHIDYQSPYGVKFLKEHPDVTIEALEKRSQFHQDEAFAHLNRNISAQHSSDQPQVTIPATLAQMLCLVLQTLSNPSPKGEHRVHLEFYQRIMNECPPEDSEEVRLIDELMQYHICADDLIFLPENRGVLGSMSDDWELPTPIVQRDAVRLLGVSDGLFLYMSKITNLRNNIRERMQAGIDPAVNFNALWRATKIDAGIREWIPSWPAGDNRDLAGLLYKHMMWVYLWRTVYPPQAKNWKIRQELTDAVNDGLEILGQFGPRDPSQTLALAPAFVLGCASFEKEQRVLVRKAIGVVKSYTEYKNSDTALEVLQEVWRLMDLKDERSWDWQTIAHGMGMDFLAT